MRPKYLTIFVGAFLLTGAGVTAQSEAPLPAGVFADRVLVNKAERRLMLYHGNKLLRSYRIALGDNPIGHKQQEGDERTPEGRYKLDYRNPHSAYHLSLHISYPNAADRASAKKRRVKPGGLIMIHGLHKGFAYLGKLHTQTDWTDGCIAVTNDEIEEIWRLVRDGTPIIILP